MLTDLEKEILQKTIWDNPYIPKDHMPFPKQIDALLDFRKELLFGGSAGGGKSDYLLMAALQFVEQPNYNAIIFRRTYSDLSLPEGLIPRSHEWLTHTPAQYKQDLHQWLFPSGSTLTFGYLESESHIYRYKCFHEDTEILTKDGWKWIRHIKMNENVATLNPTTRELEYHPVTNTYQYDYDGDLIEFYGRNSVSFAVTPNHKILYSTVDVSDLRQTEVTKLPINAKIPQYAKHFNGITPTDITFTSDGANGKSITFTPTQFAKFLGWFLSEGSLYKKRYSITITQCNEYGRKIIRELLTEIGMNFWVNDKSFRFSNKALCAYLEQFGKCRDKFIQRDVMEWNSTLLEELLYALIEGDGTWIEPGYRGHFVTMSKQLADDISEIAIKCGYRPTISLRYTGNSEDSPFKNDMCYHVAVVKKNADTRMQTCKKTTLPYKGKIYCVEVKPYHNILIRYRGRVCFIGQSAAFSFVGFEELTEFPIERFYTYLFSRMRKSTDSKIPLRMRATTNPDGPGAEWVYERFKPDDPQPLENGRRFLSSKLYDNPHIDQESYIANLEETDPVTRMQLQEGVWRVKKSGNKFKQEWFDRCYINEEDVPEEGITVRYWDLAATELKPGTRTNNDPDYTVGAKIRLYHNIYYIMDIRRDRLSPGKLEEYIQETAEFDGPDTIIYLEQEPGSSGKIMTDDYIRRVLSGYAAFSDRPTGPKEARANVFSAALYNGMVRLVRAPWNKPFVTECCLFPTKGVHDDQCLIKGTKVATIFGNKNIEDIKIGDILLTPGGTSKVTWSGQTGDNFVITNKGLTGTFGHNVFDRGNGFIPLFTHDVSSEIDTICVVNQIRWIARKLWYSMEYCTDSWERKDITLASQLPMQEEKVLKDCMLPFMSFIQTKRYQKAMLYIIKMVTLSTTQLIILSVWKSGNIANFINQKTQKNKLNILQKLGQKPPNGINQKKDMLGIKNTQKVPSTTKKGLKEHVWYVVKNLNHLLVLPNIVQKNVQDQHVGNEKRQMDTMKNAEKNENLGKQPVYNLTTEPSHTFYANNVLVSNCDAVSSAIGRLPRAKRWKNGNIGEISTFNPMAQDMAFDTGDLKIEDDGIEEFF